MSIHPLRLRDRVLFPPFLFAAEVRAGALFAALAIQNGVAGRGELIGLYGPIGAAGIAGAAIQILLPESWLRASEIPRVVGDITVSGNVRTVGPRVAGALAEVFGSPPEVTHELDGRSVYKVNSQRSWRSWGEWVEVEIRGGGSETTVTITSAPRGHQFLTFGACSRNVGRIRNSLLNPTT